MCDAVDGHDVCVFKSRLIPIRCRESLFMLCSASAKKSVVTGRLVTIGLVTLMVAIYVMTFVMVRSAAASAQNNTTPQRT